MNIKLLEDFIAKKGITKTELAVKLGITRQGLYNKLDGSREFKISEIVKISDILNLSEKEKNQIFFADFVDDTVYNIRNIKKAR